MMERIGHMVDAATGLVQARAALILCDLRKAGMAAGAYAVGAVLALAGVGVLLAALTVFLAERLGTAAALAIVGGLLVVAGAVIVGSLRARAKAAEAAARERAEREIARSAEMLRAAGEAKASRPEPPPFGMPGFASGKVGSGLGSLMQDPQLLMSGVFAAISILGARRSVRLVATLASGAGILASVARTWKSVSEIRSATDGFIPPARDRVRSHAANGRAGDHC